MRVCACVKKMLDLASGGLDVSLDCCPEGRVQSGRSGTGNRTSSMTLPRGHFQPKYLPHTGGYVEVASHASFLLQRRRRVTEDEIDGAEGGVGRQLQRGPLSDAVHHLGGTPALEGRHLQLRGIEYGHGAEVRHCCDVTRSGEGHEGDHCAGSRRGVHDHLPLRLRGLVHSPHTNAAVGASRNDAVTLGLTLALALVSSLLLRRRPLGADGLCGEVEKDRVPPADGASALESGCWSLRVLQVENQDGGSARQRHCDRVLLPRTPLHIGCLLVRHRIRCYQMRARKESIAF